MISIRTRSISVWEPKADKEVHDDGKEARLEGIAECRCFFRCNLEGNLQDPGLNRGSDQEGDPSNNDEEQPRM